MKFPIVIHEAEEGGYWAEVPELPGCVSQGDSLNELKANVCEAIALYLEEAGADGHLVKRKVMFDEVVV